VVPLFYFRPSAVGYFLFSRSLDFFLYRLLLPLLLVLSPRFAACAFFPPPSSFLRFFIFPPPFFRPAPFFNLFFGFFFFLSRRALNSSFLSCSRLFRPIVLFSDCRYRLGPRRRLHRLIPLRLSGGCFSFPFFVRPSTSFDDRPPSRFFLR